MILVIKNFKIEEISHQGKILSPDELRNPEFREKRYWDRYKTVETFLSTKTETRKGWDVVVKYPYRHLLGNATGSYFQRDFVFDLDEDFNKMIQSERNQK